MTKTTDERIESITKIYEDRIMKLEQSLEVMKIEEKKKAELKELERNLGKETSPVHIAESIAKTYEDRIMKLEQSLEATKIEEKKKAELRELERKLAKESNPVYDNQKNMMFIMFMAIILLLLIFAFGFFV